MSEKVEEKKEVEKKLKPKPKPKGKVTGKKVSSKKKKATKKEADSPLDPATVVTLPKLNDAAFTQGQIPFESIEKHPDLENYRDIGTPTGELEEGINEGGLETPITVWRQRDEGGKERFFLLAGWLRYESISNLRTKNPGSFPVVPVGILDGSFQEALIKSVTENAHRRAPNAVEYGYRIMQIMESSGGTLTGKAVAQMLGKSPAWVSTALKFARGPEAGVTKRLRHAIQSGMVNFSMGRVLADKPAAIQIAFVKACEKAQKAGEKAPKEDELEEIESEVGVLEKPKKAPRQKARSLDEILLRLEEFEAMDLTPMIEAMESLATVLKTEEEIDLVRTVLKLSHHYGQVKMATWCSGKEIDWKKAKPPFEVSASEDY